MTEQEIAQKKSDEELGWLIGMLLLWFAGVMKAYSTGKVIFFVATIALPPFAVLYGAFTIVTKVFGH